MCTKRWPQVLILVATALAAAPGATGAGEQAAFRVPARLPDVLEPVSPGAVRLDGFLGRRVENNALNRLLQVDLEPLLAGFRARPGRHPWIGEHIGKWMHAATLAWAYTGNADLRQKLDYAAAELVKCQEPDGYLGTYVPEKRFGLYPGADWDVWSHKYCLIGLLSYYEYTGDDRALDACRKIGDLLCRTFGPDKKSMLSAGTHVGMAATSVLEPMVLLYRYTGDQRYLDFCRYIVQSWDEPGGPQIIATLLEEKHVNKTANGKAYEMLSNLVGLCELARASGERRFLEPVLIAWEDIVTKRLYLTGSTSRGEHFPADYDLPNDPGAHPCETCVTTTWIQLNAQLLRLTGEARFADQLERTFYNHLAAAQRPDGAQWCYFTALEGTKPYGPGISCCVSSGPRGMALVPQQTYFRVPATGDQPQGLAVALLEGSRARVVLGDSPVTVEQQTDFPRSGRVTLVIRTPPSTQFGLRVRIPYWCEKAEVTASTAGEPQPKVTAGWLMVAPRRWNDGERLDVTFSLTPQLIVGDHSNRGRAALRWGPLVLALDQGRNPGEEPAQFLGLVRQSNEPPCRLTSEPNEPLTFAAAVCSARRLEPRPAQFVPFAEAGADGGRYQVWLRAPGAELPVNASLSAFAPESRSRTGNVDGSITDGDTSTFVVTFDGNRLDEDWYAVAFDKPVTFRRVVFAHGKTFHDGGWFDAAKGKPQIQLQRQKGEPWRTVAQLDGYPATTTTDSQGLRQGQTFSQRLEQPEQAVAVRVLGTPACGDNRQQAFSSCAELQVLAE